MKGVLTLTPLPPRWTTEQTDTTNPTYHPLEWMINGQENNFLLASNLSVANHGYWVSSNALLFFVLRTYLLISYLMISSEETIFLLLPTYLLTTHLTISFC
jgi:hypothetical protein